MPSKYTLSNGALNEIMRGGKVDEPLMQVLGSKKIAAASADKERYRLLLSDGKYLFSFAMVTTQNNERILPGEMPMHSIIKLKRYITSVINNTGKGGEKRILVILDMELMQSGEEVGERIGEPVQLPDESDASAKENGDRNMSPPPAKRPNLSSAQVMNTTAAPNLNGSSLQDQLIHPISSLSPYQNKWVIKARVMNKSAIRTWSNSRGEGKLFSMDLIDESGEIRVTAFKEAVDKYYDFVEIDKVYYISKCQLKMANKQFSTLKNDYEMTITNDTVIQECADADDSVNIPTTKFEFLSIDKVATMEVGSVVDLIGICKQSSEIQTFTAKSTGRELKKRELILVDTSKTSIALTLWGQDAENYDLTTPVVALKGVRVGEFGGGKNVSAPGSSIIKYNPDIPEAFSLRGWYDNGGDHEDFNNVSARSGTGGSFQTNWMSFKEVKDQGLGNSERGYYYHTKGTVLMMKSDKMYYKACPQDSCNKKVVDLENGQFRCEKCNTEYPNFKYRLLGNANIGDWSGSNWVSMFNEDAEKVLGKTAQEIGEAVEMSEDNAVAIASSANFKEFIFKCRAKMETYNDEARLKTVAVKIEDINYKEYNAYLISQIEKLVA